MQPIQVGLGLGSNQGDRIAQFRAAKKSILGIPGVSLVGQSSLYETEPVGVKPEYQHLKFLNAVLIISTSIPLTELHRALAAIETDSGRRRGADQYAPRPLDIDILFAGDMVSDEKNLRLPHPQCFKRRFVLSPLAEISPDRILPTAAKTVAQLLAELTANEQVKRLSDSW